MKETVSLIITLSFISLALTPEIICLAKEPTAGELLKSQEALEKEHSIRKRIERHEKIFIEKIIVEGVKLVAQEKIREITFPFEKKWLSKEDIRQILSLIQGAYRDKGYALSENKISHKIKKPRLIIKIKE